MPKGSITHRVTVPASTDEVWLLFQEPATWKGIGPIDDIDDVRIDQADRLVSFGWNTHIGPTRYRGKSAMVKNVPGERLLMKLTSSEMSGSLKVNLKPEDTETLVTVQLDFVAKGPMSSLFFPLISEAIKNGLRDQVDSFAANWEQDG